MESVAALIATTTEDGDDLIEKLRGQLLTALSLLMTLGFDVLDLRDYFLT